VIVTLAVKNLSTGPNRVGVRSVLAFTAGHAGKDHSAFGHAAFQQFGHEQLDGPAVRPSIRQWHEIEFAAKLVSVDLIAPSVAQGHQVMGYGTTVVARINPDAAEIVGAVQFGDNLLLPGKVDALEMDAQNINQMRWNRPENDKFRGSRA